MQQITSSDLIALEATAGRIEGIFSARPDLARLWRGQAALLEASRTVAMEDIHIHEGDLILRLVENEATSAENARGVSAARDALRVLRAPGDLVSDPARVIRRAARASVQMQEGGGVPELTDEDCASITRAMQAGAAPFLSALRAAVRFRRITEGWSPSVDRLVFLAAEHSLRGMEARPWGPRVPDDPFGLGMLSGMTARWTYLPATALTQGGFRSWSPMQASGVHSLIDGLRAEQSRTLGAIPILERWVNEATAYAAAKHGKSRLRDLVTLATYCPVLTVAMIRDGLGLKQRAAFNLVDEAEAAGILRRITARKTYRVWAVPSLADRVRTRPLRPTGSARVREVAQEEASVDTLAALHDPEATAAREEALLSDLDAALARIDDVLKTHDH